MTGSSLRQGACYELALTGRPGDRAEIRVLLDVCRDLEPGVARDRPWALLPVRGAVLVEVSAGGRVVLPGAWAEPGDLAALPAIGHRPVTVADLRMPAFVLGFGSGAVLAWGETVWELPFDDSLAIPEACRPAVHSAAALRRLALVALDRRADVGLTLWNDPAFEVPWRDVRLVPRAKWWFDMAQVPASMRYADAARARGIDLERALPRS